MYVVLYRRVSRLDLSVSSKRIEGTCICMYICIFDNKAVVAWYGLDSPQLFPKP